jgi:hypothetical protein
LIAGLELLACRMSLLNPRRLLAVVVSLAFLLAAPLQLMQAVALDGSMPLMAGCHDPISNKCPEGMSKAGGAAKVACESLCLALVAMLPASPAPEDASIGAIFLQTSADAVSESIQPDTSPPRG